MMRKSPKFTNKHKIKKLNIEREEEKTQHAKH